MGFRLQFSLKPNILGTGEWLKDVVMVEVEALLRTKKVTTSL